MKILFYICFSLLLFNLITSSKSKIKSDEKSFSTQTYTVTNIIKRPETYYTQGIFLEENGSVLFESGGLYKESVLVKMEYPSLKLIKKVNLNSKLFAEGIARCGDFIYQLTWREGQILKYSYSTLELVERLDMDNQMAEGWGLSTTNNENELIASDGSTRIYYLDCNDNLKVIRKIEVTVNDRKINYINELAFAQGHIWANRYQSKIIYKINPQDGKVINSYDMSELVNHEIKKGTLTNNRLNQGEVLNGIAYDQINQKFLLTGKKWGYYYEVQFK